MNCPRCNIPMEPGGIITGGVTAMWHPQKEFGKKGLKKLYYTGGKAIGRTNLLLKETKIPDAWFCPRCNIVTGIFDVVDKD